ncbi:unnamed protein product [Xylocopa violacea]|uniref:Uncharacterized protein n=1 Tax=Xylocopa violacea TaxID=135666 RepID=A0ABP1N7G9_XYLVO
MKLTALFLLFLIVGALAISKRSDEHSGEGKGKNHHKHSSEEKHHHHKAEGTTHTGGSLGVTVASGITLGGTGSQPSNDCVSSSSNVLIQLAEALGVAISLLLKPVLQLLGFSSVGDLLLFVVKIVQELLDAVLHVPIQTLLNGTSAVTVFSGYPTLRTLIQLLVNILKIPLGLVGTLLAAVLALVSKLL